MSPLSAFGPRLALEMFKGIRMKWRSGAAEETARREEENHRAAVPKCTFFSRYWGQMYLLYLRMYLKILAFSMPR